MKNYSETISIPNGRSFVVTYHLDKYLTTEFRNGQYGLNIDSKFFASKQSAKNYGLRQCFKLKPAYPS